MKLAIVTSSGFQQTDIAVRKLLATGFSVLERPLSVSIAEVVKEFSPGVLYLFCEEFGRKEADISRVIREQDNSIAIVLISDDVDNRSQKAALSSGVDLIMPNDADVVAAHVDAMARRLDRETGKRHPSQDSLILDAGNVRLDRRIYAAFCNGDRIPLTPMEFRVLWALLEQLNSVVSPDQAIQRAGGFASSPRDASDSLKVFIRRIRVKLRAAGANVHIQTVRGFGYMATSVTDVPIANVEVPMIRCIEEREGARGYRG